VAFVLGGDGNSMPIPPAKAAKLVGKKCTVEMKVQASKNAMEHRKVMFLDSEVDFRDEKNFAVVISAAAVEKFKKQGIDDPCAYFKGKLIRASGTVTLDEKKKPRIMVDDPKQIELINKDS
jgi:hypothetical protein